MNSCTDDIIKNYMNKASEQALYNIYNNMSSIATLNDVVDKYKPVSDIIYNRELYNDAINPEYNLKTKFNFDFNANDLLTNGKNNLFIYDNDNTESNIKIYANCAATAGSVWFTSSNISNNNNVCTIDKKNIQLPNGLEFNSDKSLIITNFKSKDPNKYAYCPNSKLINKAYCENRWYDWIITPNYYLGNTYFKDIGKYTLNDVNKCYKPCEGDKMPYTNSKGEYKCINKKYYANGIFSKKYAYSPIGLINLIGNIAMIERNDDIDTKIIYKKSGIYILHKLLIDYKIKNNVDTDIYSINKNILNIINSDNDLVLYSNYNNIYDEFKKVINDDILKKFDDYNNSKSDYESSNFFSYKHPLFNENDPELYTLKGLEANNLLIEPILLHTWLLANIFAPLNKDTILEDLTLTPITNAYNSLLFNKLKLTYNDDNKIIRLKNIFYKAVNICYDNKTDFSRNIIRLTKKAINSSTMNLILDEYAIHYNNNYYKFWMNNNNISISDILQTNYIDSFKGYEYYDDYDLCKLKSINITYNNQQFIDDDNIYKYFYTLEKLETKYCSKCNYNEYNVCEVIDSIVTTNTENIDKPQSTDDLNDEFNMPNFNNIILLVLRIVVVIIIIYIIYIFYDIFGETISVFINTIYVNLQEFNYITLTSKLYDEDNSIYWKNIAKLDRTKLENVERKIRKIDIYKKENNID